MTPPAEDMLLTDRVPDCTDIYSAMEEPASYLRIPTQEVGRAHRIRALHLTSRFGWITASILCAYRFGLEATPTQQRLTRRLLADLVEERYLLERHLGHHHIHAYALSKTGVDVLRAEMPDWDARSGKDVYVSATPEHDVAAAQLLCDVAQGGGRFVTEVEIKRMLRFPSATHVTDGLIGDAAGERWVELEVERARKSGMDLERAAAGVGRTLRGVTDIVGVRPQNVLFLALARPDLDRDPQHRRSWVGALRRHVDEDATVHWWDGQLERRGWRLTVTSQEEIGIAQAGWRRIDFRDWDDQYALLAGRVSWRLPETDRLQWTGTIRRRDDGDRIATVQRYRASHGVDCELTPVTLPASWSADQCARALHAHIQKHVQSRKE